jgi:hypothetical protein
VDPPRRLAHLHLQRRVHSSAAEEGEEGVPVLLLLLLTSFRDAVVYVWGNKAFRVEGFGLPPLCNRQLPSCHCLFPLWFSGIVLTTQHYLYDRAV